MNKRINQQRGMSLLELMIAMLIGVLLLGGAATMFIANKRIYKEQNEMGLLQENARFAMELLADNIRMAGHVGCHDDPLQVTNNLNGVAAASNIMNYDNMIEGTESGANWSPSNSTDDTATMVANTDGITVRYFQPFGINTTTSMAADTDNLNVVIGSNIQPGDILAVSDCESADIFQNSNVDSNTDGILQRSTAGGLTPGNSVNTLSKNYQANAAINRIISRRYFIRNSTNGTGPALWWSHVGGAEELVEGVENMQILFGEDTSGNGAANGYFTADAVTDWERVVSVRIALLMRTVEEYGEITDTSTYNLLGTVINPVDDRRRRRVFSTTIQVRNGSSS